MCSPTIIDSKYCTGGSHICTYITSSLRYHSPAYQSDSANLSYRCTFCSKQAVSLLGYWRPSVRNCAAPPTGSCLACAHLAVLKALSTCMRPAHLCPACPLATSIAAIVACGLWGRDRKVLQALHGDQLFGCSGVAVLRPLAFYNIDWKANSPDWIWDILCLRKSVVSFWEIEHV